MSKSTAARSGSEFATSPSGVGMTSSKRLLIQACHLGLGALKPVTYVVGRQRPERPIAWIERQLKGLLFDCRMCGHCLLDTTGLGCPMRCAKGLRNGPCGGVRADGTCELDATRICAWNDIWMRTGGLLPERQPPLDNRLSGRSTWLAEALEGRPETAPLPARREIPAGRLQRQLTRGDFVITAEIAPGTAADASSTLAEADKVGPWVDAINVTDSSGAHAALSSLAAAALLVRAGHTAVMQMTCRDRNRIALQNDLLSATALGIENVLCLTGDGVANGDHPEAKAVFDLDAISLLATARTQRDGGTFLSGRALAVPPGYFIGAVGSPFAPPEAARIQRLERKIEAGAQFVQTQYVFDVPGFAAYMAEVRARGLHRRCFILPGVGLLASVRTARWLATNVPGVRIPEHIMKRLEMASDPLREGIRLAVEIIQGLRAIDGVAGVHLMFNQRFRFVGEVIEAAGLGRREQRCQAIG